MSALKLYTYIKRALRTNPQCPFCGSVSNVVVQEKSCTAKQFANCFCRLSAIAVVDGGGATA